MPAVRLTQGLTRARQWRGAALAVADDEGALTWDQFGDRVARLAGLLQRLGVRRGDRVAMLAANGRRYLEAYLAVPWLGAILTPLNHRLAEPELAAMLGDAEPAVLLVDAAQAVLGARLKRPGLQLVHAAPGPAPDGMVAYEDALAAGDPIADADCGDDDVACLFYTGGTTAAAKGVMLTHANLIANALNFGQHVGLDETIIHLHCGPLFHVAAGARIYSVTLAAGTHVVLPRFDAPRVLAAIARHRVTLATFVPTMVKAILDQPDLAGYDLSSLRYVTYGAAPMPEALLRRLMHAWPAARMVQSYGMTELSPVATMLGWRDHVADGPRSALLRSAGRAVLTAELRIVDTENRDVPQGMVGEVLVRGPMVMKGYWRRPDLTAAALSDGWMRTGDAGYLDGEGYLFVVDRLKDIIITGGENVHSVEVENAIYTFPGVAECAVIGLPDPVWGEAVHAIVVPKADAEIDPAALTAHCRGLIAGFKCPRTIVVRHEPLPLSGANKVLKSALRAEALRQGAP